MRSAPPSWALALLALPACSVDANYNLQLTPRVPVNEAPFETGPSVHLRMQDGIGNVDWVDLGALTTGTIEENGFGPLEEHAIGIGLGGDPATDPGSVFAWGHAGPITAGAEREQLEVQMLIAQSDGVGSLGQLDQTSHGAGVAVTSDGNVYFFGGTRALNTSCTSMIHKVTDLNEGTWDARSLATALPRGVCHPVVHVVEANGSELIVVSGGETVYGNNASRIKDTVIFNPATDMILWTGEGAFSRARDFGAVTNDGRILYVGAHQVGATAPVAATWEVFDPSSRAFGDGGSTGVKPWGFMASAVGGGVALCGGATWSGSTVTPARTCEILSADGSTESLPSLPVALRDGGMTTLADGRLLVAGGIAQTGQAGTNLAAQSRAWVLDPVDGDDWEGVDPLGTGRAYFRLVADPFGSAAAIGGVGAGWGYGAVPMSVPDCGERFSSADGSWERLDPCGVAGAGLLPTIGTDPSWGLITLQGRMENTDGGLDYGIVSLGPPP